MKLSANHESAETRVITNDVASPIPIAVSIFFDVPIKGHKPKNFDKTKLLTKIALKKSNVYSDILDSSVC